MKVLVLNCGSSSVKFQLFDADDGNMVLAKGLIEKIGSTDAAVNYYPKDKNALREIREVLNHETAIEIMLSLLLHPQHGVISKRDDIQAVGHRVVHGGEESTGSVLVTDTVKAAIRRCIQFAPLHNPHNLKGIEGCETLLPGIPQVAVFDTAFHHTIPAKAFLYGLPYTLYKKLGIRRYGFHGTSHRYVAEKAADFLGRPLTELKLITCHLGNGASITAVDEGKSVDTSMGFTPLEGVMMGTRCGDIDPAIVPYIMDKENLNTKQVDALMNKNSGLLGLTGTSNDMREVEAEAARGNEQHKIAIEVYCYRIRKYIGSYLAVLGGADAIVFTGGIGENAIQIRGKIVEGLERLGIRLDREKNRRNQTAIGDGPIAVLVVPTNEELAIVKDTLTLLDQEQKNLSFAKRFPVKTRTGQKADKDK
jgi:acetate kinase